MDSSTAAKTVLIVGGVMAAWVLLTNDPIAGHTYKRLWGVAALTLVLSIAADFITQVAGPFAILCLVGGATRNKGKIGKAISTGTGKG